MPYWYVFSFILSPCYVTNILSHFLLILVGIKIALALGNAPALMGDLNARFFDKVNSMWWEYQIKL